MRFGEPQWLWLGLLAPALALFLFWAIRRRERDLARWCHPALWNRMVPDRSGAAAWIKGSLLLLAVLFLALMAARPQLGSRMLAVERKGIDVIIALDTSESMLAEDLPPNRITRARQEIQSLVERLRGDRVGLVAFSGEAFVQCPLTLDYAAARMFLRFMDTDLIPVPGTAVAEAIRSATRAFDPKERKFKALVLITDGEDHEGNVDAAAQEAKEQGIRIFAVGIGTTKGEPIPMRDASGNIRDYKRDRGGNVIMTHLDPTALRQICDLTGGRYYDGNSGGLALDRLYGEIAGMEQKEMKGGIVTQYEDRYVYFAAAAFLLLALEALLGERRRRAARSASWAALFLAALLCPAATAQAADEGTKAFRKGDYQQARDAFEAYAREHPSDPRGDYNLGTALHQTGEMAPAEEALRRSLRSTDPKVKEAAFYNLGNTRARAGDLPGAVEAYEMALRLNPKDKDAKQNLEIVRTLLQQPPPDSTGQQNQQKQDKNQKDEQKKDEQKKDQKDQEQQDQQNQQQNDQKNQNQDEQSTADDRKNQEEQKQDSEEQKNQEQENQQQQEQQSKQEEQGGGQGQAEQDPNKTPTGKSLPPMKISPEQARQILDGLAQQEMMLQADRLRAKSRSLKVEKDW